MPMCEYEGCADVALPEHDYCEAHDAADFAFATASEEERAASYLPSHPQFAGVIAQVIADERERVLAVVLDQALAFDCLSARSQGTHHSAMYGFREAASHLRALVEEEREGLGE